MPGPRKVKNPEWSVLLERIRYNIKRWRCIRRLTQEKLMLKAGTPMVRLLEQPHAFKVQNPSLVTLHMIADALGIPIASLFDPIRGRLVEKHNFSEGKDRRFGPRVEYIG